MCPQSPVHGQPARTRGVTRDKVSFDGSSVYHIVDRDGRLRFRVEVCAQDSTFRTLRWFWRVLETIDPPAPTLTIVD
jgi:hypothetical protein